MHVVEFTLKERFHPNRFFIGEKPTAAAVVLSHRRIFILPSKAGLCCGLLLGIMLSASVVYNNNLSFILTFLLGSVCLVSVLHNFRSMAGLSINVGRSTTVFAGDLAEVTLLITNPSELPRINLRISAQHADTTQISITPRATASPVMKIKTYTRGWQTLGTVTIASYFPIGLFRAWSPINFAQRILVYPKPAAHSVALSETFLSPQNAVTRNPDGDDFFGLQSYQNGDSLRQIHWQAFAKGRGVHTKQYGGDRSPEIWLDLDQTPGDTLELRISLLCRWIIDAEQSGAQYGLRLPHLSIGPDAGASHHSKCLRALALL